ncbi:MAG: hypothetical protein N0C90_24160, partial [Candidatus Thiodiazotropha endolucinida]|nr:hypothetical protein [Candidatus Thiodiazotropha taylori]MCW4264447.1 hypothetical protein [Candidatus Thiodiazotropha endolucinida]
TISKYQPIMVYVSITLGMGIANNKCIIDGERERWRKRLRERGVQEISSITNLSIGYVSIHLRECLKYNRNKLAKVH